jgi:hypothetical protein
MIVDVTISPTIGEKIEAGHLQADGGRAVGSPDDDVEIWRRSMPKTLLMLLAGVPLIALGVALAFGWLGEDLGIFSRLIGWVGTLFFVAAVLMGIWQLLLGDRVVIQVGPLGLHDRRVSSQPIPWGSIDGIEVQKVQRVRSLKLYMTPEAQGLYMRSRQLARLSARMVGGVTVNTGGLDRSFDDLIAAVNKWYQQPTSSQ